MAKEVGAAYVSIFANMKNFSKGVEKGLTPATVAIGNLMSEAVSGAAEFIGSGLEKGIKRLDTIQNFPKLMSEFGYSAKDAEGYVKQVADHLVGLPGSTDEVLSLVQALSDSTSSLGLATSTGISFNDMLTAAGADASTATLAMRTFDQIMGGGTVTAQRWQSLTSKMPKQFNMLAENILGAGASSVQLGEALQGGEVTLEQLAQAMTDLGPQFEKQARAMSNGIGTALENIPNRLAAGWESVLNVFGQENIANVINQFSTGVKDGMQSFATWLSDSLGRIKTAFDNSGIADKVGSIVSKAKAALESSGIGSILENGVKGALDIVGRALGWLDENFGRISEAVGGIAEVAMGFLGRIADSGILESIGDLVAAAFDNIANNLPDIQALGNLLIDIVDGALRWIADNKDLILTVLGGVAGFLAGIAGIKFGADMFKFMTGIVGTIKKLVAAPMLAIPLAIGAIVAALITFFTQTETGRKMWSDFTSALGQFIEDAKPVVEGAINAVSGVVKGFLDWLSTDGVSFFTSIADTIGGALEFIVGLFTGNEDQISHGWETFLNGLGSLVDGALGVVRETFTNILAGIVSLFGVDFDEAKQIVSDVFDAINNIVETVFGAIVDFVTPPIEAIAGAFEWLKDQIGPIIEGIGGVIGGIGDFFSDPLGTIGDFVAGGTKDMKTMEKNFSKSSSGIEKTVGKNFNAAKKTATDSCAKMRDAAGRDMDTLKNKVSSSTKSVKDDVSKNIGNAQKTMSDKFSAAKTDAGSYMGNIASTVDSKMTSVKNSVTNKSTDAAKNMKGKLSDMSSETTSKMGSIYSTTNDKMGKVEGKISSSMQTAYNNAKKQTGNIQSTINGLKGKTVDLKAKNALGTVVGNVQGKINGLKGKTVDLKARNALGSTVSNSQKKVNSLKGKTVGLNAEDNISGACSKAQKSINGLYGKTVSINFNAYQTGIKAVEVQSRVWADTRRIEVTPTYVASGGIATKPTLSIWGEAGSEAIIPLSNRSKVRPFARAVAAEMGAGGGVTVTGNTFIVRDDSDIDRIADRINEKVNRARAGALR